MRCALPAALLASVALSSASAYVRSGPGVMPHGHHRLLGSVAVAPPLDGLTAASGAYGFRRLRTAYAGPAAKLQRVDTTQQDIGFVGNDFDVAAAAAFCSTACGVQTLYDQTGNARHLVQATAAAQPVYVAACQNGQPCLQMTLNTQFLNGPSITPATGLVSLNVVANRAVGTTASCTWLRENGANNRVISSTVPAAWTLAPSPTFSMAAADAVWHAAVGIVHPTAGSSVLNIDGTEGTGTTVPVVTAGAVGIFGQTATTCNQAEAVFWDNYALSPAERTALVANQRGYWGF